MAWPKRIYRGLLLVALLALGTLAWALFWPGHTCSEPACARERFALYVEMDSFRGIEPVPLEVQTPTRPVSVQSILRSGGIDVSIEPDDDTLPYAPESGPLDRADLYQYALAWRNRAAPSRADAQIYAVMTPALVSDRGERLFGIMFDSAGREGVAVAPRETQRTFGKGEGESIPLLQLRTFMHEMLHALNRRHMDAARTRDGRLTLEAPTRCLVDKKDGQWFLSETPLMALSPSTIQFFQTATPRDVLPGGSNTPFEGLRSSATECADVRSNSSDVGIYSRWEFARQRLLGLVGIRSANAEEAAPSQLEQTPPVSLRVQAQPAAYPLGYPIAVRLMVWNRSEEPLPLRGRLAPAYGLVQVQYRFKDAEEWRAYQPLAWYEAADEEEAMLPPGAYHEQTAEVYFGDGGWTFPKPGAYELRALLKASEEAPNVISNIVPIRIGDPQTESEKAVLQPLLGSDGALDAGIGRLLIFGGRIGDPESQAPLEEVVDHHRQTALGSALKLTIASQRLSPPIDPLTGERSAPDFANAGDLLRDTCTDSGIAALKHELLTRFADEIPPSLTIRLQSSAEAWDGISSNGEVIATYSDPQLRPFGPSIHFCSTDAALAGKPQNAVASMARDLRRAEPSRIVVVGHSDHEGSCRFNDALALERAESVKRALIDAGVPRKHIRTVTLGERRPIDFASTDEASQLNRRVDVLVELATPQEEQPKDEREVASDETETERIVPRC